MDEQKRFEWQEGYAAFSVSPSSVERVKHYLQWQEEHHRAHTFEEELLSLLDKAGIPHNVDDVLAA